MNVSPICATNSLIKTKCISDAGSNKSFHGNIEQVGESNRVLPVLTLRQQHWASPLCASAGSSSSPFSPLRQSQVLDVESYYLAAMIGDANEQRPTLHHNMLRSIIMFHSTDHSDS
ncbi:hypothetical protein A0H81_07338 [Grifola frondosa]|uniref:Uncharacterized protein n=1 Tax=Grifola frondosa TaxID=5627 RepID=A0A1C7M794_GRIFR|nr:hypothetical protein A0H81_07338 [Grifola frondosa]